MQRPAQSAVDDISSAVVDAVNPGMEIDPNAARRKMNWNGTFCNDMVMMGTEPGRPT
jgi:hypothetical protein